ESGRLGPRPRACHTNLGRDEAHRLPRHPPQPIATWAPSSSLPVKTTHEFFSTESFSDNSHEVANCASRISSLRTTLYKFRRTDFRILPSKQFAFARMKRPNLSSTFNHSLIWRR